MGANGSLGSLEKIRMSLTGNQIIVVRSSSSLASHGADRSAPDHGRIIIIITKE